jgi:RimJ/RimL family protein N-acetyltransferase
VLPGGAALTGAAAAPVISLRPVEDGDLPLFFEWQADEESYRMAAVPTRDAEAFAAHWARNRSNPENLMRTIVADDVVVGNALSWTGDEGRMVGYWIAKAHWGRGIAGGALRLYLDDVEQHRPLLASVAEHNAASRRVLEKAGFQFVARELVDDGPQPGTFAELHFRLG